MNKLAGSTVEVVFTQPNVGNSCVYSVCVDGEIVANVYGPMAAIATEAICRAIEDRKMNITIHDVFNRVKLEE